MQLLSPYIHQSHSHTYLDWERIVPLSCGAIGMAALAVDAMILRYHTAIVSSTVGSVSLAILAGGWSQEFDATPTTH